MELKGIKMKDKKRITYWDIAKGITIVLVIIGHTGDIPLGLRSLIFSFHMPLFFWANAVFIKNFNIKKLLTKSSRSLLVPYVVTCLISAGLCVYRNNDINTNYIVFRNKVIDMFVGISRASTRFNRFGSVWLVWFVACLFVARFIYVVVMKCIHKLPYIVQIIIIMILCMSGYYIGTKVAFLPWSADVSLFSLPLFWFGNHMNDMESWLDRIITMRGDENKTKKHGVRLIKPCIVILLTVIWLALCKKGFWIEMATRRYPGVIVCLVCAMCGIVFIVAVSRIIDRYDNPLRSFLIWCGSNSMIILIFHCIEMRFFQWDAYIYLALPCSVDGIWYREAIVKASLIIVASYMVVAIKEWLMGLTEQKTDEVLS